MYFEVCVKASCKRRAVTSSDSLDSAPILRTLTKRPTRNSHHSARADAHPRSAFGSINSIKFVARGARASSHCGLRDRQ
jgi:hypothetical protein